MKFRKITALLMSLLLLANTAVLAVEIKPGDEEEEIVVPFADYINVAYSSPREKLATMDMYLENDKYQLYGLADTGEIALVVKGTEQILFSNPYDVGAYTTVSVETKQKILSQILLKYSVNNSETIMNTYKDAALNRQISMEPIRGGIRVNYTMGREEARILVPELIEKTRFEEEILAKMPQKDENGRTIVDPFVNKNPYRYMEAYFTLKDANAEGLSEDSKNKMMQVYPITKKYAVYMLATDTSVKEKKNLEHLITTYTDYTFDDLEADHAKVEYVSKLDTMPLFKVAIEYYLDDDGLKVRVPASDIRFNSTAFSLKTITILPYFGAGSSTETGYTLVADGSGSLVRFEDLAQSNTELTITSKIYGQDHSFHQVAGANQEVLRLPSFGVSRDYSYPDFDTEAYKAAVEAGEIIELDDVEGQKQAIIDAKNNPPEEKDEEKKEEEETEEKPAEEETDGEEEEEKVEEIIIPYAQSKPYVKSDNVIEETSGYIAYIEEGESLGEISTAHGGVVHPYNSAYATFTPRPSDSYELTGVSATGSAMWSVTSDRKYTGNFTIRYMPVGEERATTAGMAATLRDYLVNKGILTKMEDDGNYNIPLYLETFGSVETTKRVAGIPFDVQTPLTTFEDSKNMITELQNGVVVDEGTDAEKTLSIKDIVIKYTGWYNGGLYRTVPSKLKIDKAIGGEEGLRDLVAFAKDRGVKIFPDFEYTYVNKVGRFDDFDYKEDAVQTIDGRTSVHKNYSALFQQYSADGQLILSPIAMSKFYNKMIKKYSGIGVGAISAATLGSDLSSDHNDDYPMTREDAKEEIAKLLGTMKEDNGSLMVSGGNAYTFASADHIINAPLTSSENVFATESVPFYGMVLHGYKSFAGTAINLDGDYEKSVLKAIENGASPYFILSARNENTSELKSFADFSKYYSIRYNIWKEDLVKTYNRLNDALGSVKYETITSHKYIDNRVVKVEYSNGTSFILNYNTSPVEVDGVTVEAMDFVKQ